MTRPRPTTLRLVTVLVTLGCAAIAVAGGDAGDWTSWRGPNGTGYVPDAEPAVRFSDTKNVKWKTAIPGKGYASPVVHGDRIYLMSAIEIEAADARAPLGEGGFGNEAVAGLAQPRQPQRGNRRRGGRGAPPAPPKPHRFVVIAVDRTDGTIIWEKTVCEATPHEGTHGTSTHASGSCIVDPANGNIYASFGSRGIYCLDPAGEVLWTKNLGKMQTRRQFGEGASPALHGGVLVVPWDHEADSFVVALDAKTGEEKWRDERDESTNWATPGITEVNGRAQVILPGTSRCAAYDLESGDIVWETGGLTMNCIPTPAFGNGMVYLMSGFRGAAVKAVRLADAKGTLTDESDAVVWTHGRGTPYIPSPVLTGDRLYFLGSSSAILSCLNAKTGEPHYVGQRMEAVRSVYASIAGGGGYIYICGREGNVEVIKDGETFEHVATNSMGEGINATPAFVGGDIYLRGDVHLFCIAIPEARRPTGKTP